MTWWAVLVPPPDGKLVSLPVYEKPEQWRGFSFSLTVLFPERKQSMQGVEFCHLPLSHLWHNFKSCVDRMIQSHRGPAHSANIPPASVESSCTTPCKQLQLPMQDLCCRRDLNHSQQEYLLDTRGQVFSSHSTVRISKKIK